MTRSLTTAPNSSSPATKPSQLSPDTEQVLAAGEGQGTAAMSPDGGFDGAAWAPPANITAGQENALRSDLAAIEAKLSAGCDIEWVYDRLGELAAITATRSDVTEQEYGYKLRVMAQALSEHPASVVQSACERYPRECKWFPELADLLRYVEEEKRPLANTRARIRLCLTKRQHERPRNAWRPPSPADKDQAREMVAGFKAQVAELDEQERKANRSAPSKLQPARRNLPEGPGQRAARLRREEIERMHENGTEEANNG